MEVHHTKRQARRELWDLRGIERGVRQMLADKVSGTMVGLWLLVPEHLRLGTWDLLRGWTGEPTEALAPRLAMQLVHEAALCRSGVREQRSLNQRGFDLANGLPFVATDQQIHNLLDAHTVDQARRLQIALGKLRRTGGHLRGEILAIDPHRLVSYSKRPTRLRKGHPRAPAAKTSQTFFCLDADTGQPVGFTLGTSARTLAQAVPELLALTSEVLPCRRLRPLVLADREHFTAEPLDHVRRDTDMGLLVPMPKQKHLRKKLRAIEASRFAPRWAGLATTKMPYALVHSRTGPFCMMAQRFGEAADQYEFNSFLCTADRDEVDTLTLHYPKRWHIELLIKDEKQQLGLGDYRVLRYRAVVRHLHLVDIAYACLTHLGLKDQRAQGRKKTTKVLRLPPISQLKTRMRQLVWREAVQDVVKHSHERPVIRRLEKLLAA